MIKEQLLNNLDEMSKTYEADPDILDALRGKTMIPLLGPFAVGKTTLIRGAVQINGDQFHRVRGFTTRTPRYEESAEAYTFFEHSEGSLKLIQEQAERQELVQFIVHPTTRKVYGSTINDYGVAPNVMMDVLPGALPPIEALPFGRIEKVEVVASPLLWRERMQERFLDNDPEDIANRLAEADDNLVWALDQGEDMTWLANSRSVHEGALSLKEIADGEYSESNVARFTGEALLREIRAMRSR